MKLGFKIRRVWTKITNIICFFREFYFYFLNVFFENSFKKPVSKKIKTLLTLQMGAVGDTYNFLGILNELAEKYPYLKIYCLTNHKSFYKNPRLSVITPEKAKELINEGEIDSLISYGDLSNFFKNKRIVFKIPNRSGKLFPYKTRPFADEVLPMFRKLGFKIDNLKFYFTEEGKKTAKKFYKENNIKKPVFLHIGSNRTIRALNEGKIPPSKWAPEKWAKVSDYLIEKYNCTIIFTGVEEEKPLIKEVISKIKNKDKVLNIAGRFSIEEVASIFKNLVIGVDSGMIHVLSQINIPVIILFTGDPKISKPHKNSINIWGGKGVCNNCRKYYCPEGNPVCTNSIRVEDILNKLPGYKHEE